MTRAQRIALILTAVAAAIALVLAPILFFQLRGVRHDVDNHQPCKSACQRNIVEQLRDRGGGASSTGSSPSSQPGPPPGGSNGGGEGPSGGAGGGIGTQPGGNGTPPADQPGLLDPVTDPLAPLVECHLTAAGIRVCSSG